jgi:hypothetical protein
MAAGDVGGGDAIFAVFRHNTFWVKGSNHHFLLYASIDYVKHLSNRYDDKESVKVTDFLTGKPAPIVPKTSGGVHFQECPEASSFAGLRWDGPQRFALPSRWNMEGEWLEKMPLAFRFNT